MSTGEMVVSSNQVVLVRDDHPEFLTLVEQFLRWAESADPDDERRPSAWFVSLLAKWVDEDRRIPVIHFVRPPRQGKHSYLGESNAV